MKKLLALVLALVMTMSLVTISNAAFKDANSIDYKEAVEVMNKVGVLIGDEKGNFNAKDTLTRGQAAKIVAYLDLGGKTADAIKGSGAVFTDVKATDWFAGYVEYCAGAGYVAGMGDKTFAPNEKVTGVQFAKMLLCALGYKAEIEGYTGSDYTIAIARDANKNDLFKGLSIATSANLTREQAAQMAFNALKADVVEYQGGTEVSTSDGTKVTVNATRYNVTVNGASINFNNAASTDSDYGTQQLAEKLYDSDLKKTSTPDDFGRPATKWTYKNDEIGTYADTADYVFTAKVTKKVLYNTVGKDVYDDLTATKDPTTLTVWVDGKDSKIAKADIGDYMDKNSTAKIGGKTGNGTLTEVYVDDDNNVKIVIINTYVVKASDDYNSKKEEVKVDFPEKATSIYLKAGEKTLSQDDWAVSDVEKDDYLLITVAVDEIKSVEKAATVTGEVSSYSTKNDVTIGGTTYKYTNNIAEDDKHGKAVEFSTGDDACVVLDAYGYIIYVDDAKASSDNYVFVKEFGEKGDFDSDKDVIAKAYFLDGTNKTITVKDGDSASKAGWYTYTEKKSGKYELTAVETADAATATAAVGSKLTENGKITVGTATTFKANKSTIFVVLDDDEVKLYEGISKVPTLTATAKSVKGDDNNKVMTAYAKMDDGYAEYVFIDATDATSKNPNKSTTDYVYLLKFDRKATDNKDNVYYQYKAIVNGEETKIKLDDSFSENKTVNTLYEDISYDAATGYVTDMAEVENGGDYKVDSFSDVKITYSNGVVSLIDTNVLADNYKIYLVVAKGVKGINDNDDDYTVDTVTGSGLETECNKVEVNGSYVAVLNDDDEITDLYVYVAGLGTKA